ncbi:DeoR family transcriptional regulator, partial [Clostridium perfringens]
MGLYNSLSPRQQKIIDYLTQNKEAKTEELSELFNTAPITIRRDFKELESMGLVLRYYGGAKILEDEVSNETDIVKIKKQSIAKYA